MAYIAASDVSGRLTFGAKWFLTRLAVYAAVAMGSAVLFFAGATIYAYVVPVAPPIQTQSIAPAPTPPISVPITPAESPTPALEMPSVLMVKLPSGQNLMASQLYKQNVYDQKDSTVGYIADVVIDPERKAPSLIVSVGGFLGVGKSKNISVPLTSVEINETKGSPHVYWSSATKDTVAKAPGYKYDQGAWKVTITPAPAPQH